MLMRYLSLWLISSYSSFCTGSVFTIDGGQTRKFMNNEKFDLSDKVALITGAAGLRN